MGTGKTHVFKLTSGVECEVIKFKGKHQRILTENKHKELGDNLIELLANTIVRVGSVTEITEEFVKGMLSSDRKLALCAARQFTMRFEDKFKFEWEYDSLITEEKASLKMEINLKPEQADEVESEGAEEVKKNAMFPMKPCKNQYTEYKEIPKYVELKLPDSGVEVGFRMLDGYGESSMMKTKKAERSSHTAILMRQPVYFQKTENDRVGIKIDSKYLDNMEYEDIEALRTAIKEHEGSVDTEIRFAHPEAELLPKNEQQVVVDLLGQIAFFFPSEAI